MPDRSSVEYTTQLARLFVSNSMEAMMGDEREKVFRHESYGMVGLYRQTGGRERLFGSALPEHHSQVALRIQRGKRVHDKIGHCDRYTADGNEPIIEIVLSPAQYADMVSMMNVGNGVPCTIRSIGHELLEKPPPDESTEIQEARDGVQLSLESRLASLRALREQLEVPLSKKALSGADRESIRSILDRAITEFASNVPFAVDQFHRAADRVTTAAKAEIDAFASHHIMQRGLDAIAEERATGAITGHVKSLAIIDFEPDIEIETIDELATLDDRHLGHSATVRVRSTRQMWSLARDLDGTDGMATKSGFGRWICWANDGHKAGEVKRGS
ncbi:MAG: hypothetical protein ACHREM_08940 [Polyangiales bacterium]